MDSKEWTPRSGSHNPSFQQVFPPPSKSILSRVLLPRPSSLKNSNLSFAFFFGEGRDDAGIRMFSLFSLFCVISSTRKIDRTLVDVCIFFKSDAKHEEIAENFRPRRSRSECLVWTAK